MRRLLVQTMAAIGLLALIPPWRCSLAAAKPDAAKRASVAVDKHELAAFQPYVGQWKGVGQPRRGSSRGAWTEDVQWSWHFTDGHAELTAQIAHGHYFSALRLQPAAKPGEFRLLATPSEGKSELPFDGKIEANGSLTLTAAGKPEPSEPARITIRLVAGGDRMVLLFERRAGEQFARLAEVGATRKGSLFAVAGGDPHECIVTGGHGTIAVDYKGQTYYFCCTGCRDAFLHDPAGILAEYHQRQAAAQAAAHAAAKR